MDDKSGTSLDASGSSLTQRPALPDPNLSIVNLKELAKHPPTANSDSKKALQEAVLMQEARRARVRDSKENSTGEQLTPTVETTGSSVTSSASVPARLQSKGEHLSKESRPLLPDNRLTMTNLAELARHYQSSTITQKLLNQKQRRKKMKTLKEKYERSEMRESFLSRALSWLWSNRAYLFVGVGVMWLNSRDRLREEMMRRARDLQKQALDMRDKVAAEGLDAGLEEMRATVVRSWGSYLGNFLKLRPRTSFGILLIISFQITKAVIYFRGKSRRDPSDRLQKYPASLERKASSDEANVNNLIQTSHAGGTNAVDTGSGSVWQGGKGCHSPTGGLQSKVVSSTSILDQMLEHGGLNKLMIELNQNGVSLNHKTLQLLRSMRHFACIGDADSAAIYKKMKAVKFKRGQIVSRQGDSVSQGMFIVLRGNLVVYKKIHQINDKHNATSDQHVNTDKSKQFSPNRRPQSPRILNSSVKGLGKLGNRLSSWGPGTTLGENDLLGALSSPEGSPIPKRQISIVAESDTDALQLDLESFIWVLHRYPGAIISWIMSTTARQWRVATYTMGEVLGLTYSDVRDWELETRPLSFAATKGDLLRTATTVKNSGGKPEQVSRDQSTLPSPSTMHASSRDELLDMVALSASGTINLRPGETVYNQGDNPTALFVVISGDVCGFVVDAEGSNGRMLFEASSGTILGGVSVVGDVPMRETVNCLTDTVLAVYPKVLFSEVATVDSDDANDSEGAHDEDLTGNDDGAENSLRSSPDVAHGEIQEDDNSLENKSLRYKILVSIVLATTRAMTPVIRRFLALGMQRQLLRNGDKLYGANDPAKAMWLVISGRLRTFQIGDSAMARSKSIRLEVDVGRGQSVGEVAMFASSVGARGNSASSSSGLVGKSHDPLATHKGSCIAIRDTELVRLSHFSFMQLCDQHPRSILEITASLARRLQQDRLLTSQSRNYATICVVPAGAQSKDNFELVSGFAAKLATALEAQGHVTQLISSQKLETYLGPDSGGAKLEDFFFREQVSQWLIDQEEVYTYQVMLADPSPTAWTQLCVRQADCILCVADARDSPSMSDVESSLLFLKSKDGRNVDTHTPRKDSTVYTLQRSRKELVLLHRGDPGAMRRPRNTRKWFVDRPTIREHHHVRWHVEDDFRRVARCLSGQAVGLVLGGGGSRGLAHLGVIQEMERDGIPIDYIGGTSQGAFMGAMYASTLSTVDDKMVPEIFLRQMGSVTHYIKSLTLPIMSYFSGSNFNELLRSIFGSTQIEDFWIRFFCCTTNVTDRKLEVHQVGPAWRYLRASMTVMGLLPPMPMGDEGDLNPLNAVARTTMLVDGGYVNNIPFDIMEDLHDPAVIFVVDVEAVERSKKLRHIVGGEHVSGWWLLLRTIWGLLGFGKGVDLPSSGTVTKEVAGIAAYERLAKVIERVKMDKEAKIVYIKPEVNAYGLLDYHKSDEIVMAGRLAAREAIKSWKLRQGRISGRGTFQTRMRGDVPTQGDGLDSDALSSIDDFQRRSESRGRGLWLNMSSHSSFEGGTFQRNPSLSMDSDNSDTRNGGFGEHGVNHGNSQSSASLTSTMSHVRSIASIHAQSRHRSPSYLVFSMHNGIDGSIAGLGGVMGHSVLTNHSGGVSPPAPTRKQLSNRTAAPIVLDKFDTIIANSDAADTSLNSDNSRNRSLSKTSDRKRSRSSSGLSNSGNGERPRVARLHSQLTAAALRDRNMGTSNAMLISQSTMFSTREYESSDDDDSDDEDDMRNAVMF